jgi:hypothetical protein
MKGYIYRLYKGADPAKGWIFNDPIFGAPPTLGACVPNIRRAVEPGDWVFTISGRVDGYRPYVVGGFKVREKITALQAYRQFPEYRLEKADNGQIMGNIIVNSKGQHHSLDAHAAFKTRLQNYLVGDEALHVHKSVQIEKARDQTLATLSRVFNRPSNRDFDIVPRWRRMDEEQVENLKAWLTPLSR